MAGRMLQPLFGGRYTRKSGVLLVSACLVLFFIVYTVRDTWFPSPPPRIPPVSESIPRALVLPKTKSENVRWAYSLQPRWVPFVYSINEEPGFTLHVPANRGREAMVYLTFIIDHYHSLPEVIAFLHGGHYQWHNDGVGSRTSTILKNLYMSTVERKGYVNLRCNPIPGCPTSVTPFNPTEIDIKNKDVRAVFPDVYMQLFNVTREEVPKKIGAVCCAQFVVTRGRIRERPREDYIRMREWVLSTEYDSQTIGWVFEMIWHIIFQNDAMLCPTYEQCMCDVYGRCDKSEKKHD